MPSSRYQREPKRATSASCASVSGFWISVGRRCSRARTASAGRKSAARRRRSGSGPPRSPRRRRTPRAPQRPRTNRIALPHRSGPLERADRVARIRADLDDHPSRADGAGREQRAVEHEVREPGKQQPILRARRLGLEPLTITALTRRRSATARSLRAVGKSAPPRPRRPLRSTSSISWCAATCGSGPWTRVCAASDIGPPPGSNPANSRGSPWWPLPLLIRRAPASRTASR